MSVPAPSELPFRIDAFCYARNGAVPDVRLLNRVAGAMNNVLAYRTKCVFNGQAVPTIGSGANKTLYRFRFHAGYGAQIVFFHVGVGLGAHPTSSAFVTLTLDVAGAGTPSSVPVYYGNTQNGGVDAPDEIQWSTRAFLISPNATYEASAYVDNEARIIALAAWTAGIEDVDEANEFYVGGSSTYGQIDDATRQKLTEGQSKMWKRNGAHLLNWCTGTAKTITGATWTNVLDGTTAVASTSAGYILGAGLLTPYSRRVQPLKATFCVYGQVTGGAGTGEVRLYSDSGSGAPTFATVTGVGATLQWYTLNQTIPSGGDGLSAFSKVDLQHRMNGAGTLNLYAVSLYLYET